MKRFLRLFVGGDEPTPSQIEKAVKQVTQPHGDPAVRMNAVYRLKTWGTPAAIAGILRRFTIQTPSGAVDLQESQEVEAILVELDKAAVEPLVQFLTSEDAVSYPARALEKILPSTEFVSRILQILELLEAGFSSHGEQRAGLVRMLEEHDDPRIAPGVRPFLLDPDDDVAMAAIACVARTRDSAYRADLVEVLSGTADRPRVQREVAERLAELAWPMEESRALVDQHLPADFHLDKKGRVVGG